MPTGPRQLVDLGPASDEWRAGPTTPGTSVIFCKTGDCFVEFKVLPRTYDAQAELATYDSSPDFRARQGSPVELPVNVSTGTHPLRLASYERLSGDDDANYYPLHAVGFISTPTATIRILGDGASSSDYDRIVQMLEQIKVSP